MSKTGGPTQGMQDSMGKPGTGENFPLHHDPITEFRQWYEQALKSSEPKPDACVLATATPQGEPSARVILFKGLLDGDFTFYTNYLGQKGRELELNPQASLVFYWPTLGKQIRVNGKVSKVTFDLSQTYFHSRPRGSPFGALASPQSQRIPSRRFLEDKVKVLEEQYAGKIIPCPPHWGGYRLRPRIIEFWIDQPDRLHDRFQYQLLSGEGDQRRWEHHRLAP